MFTFRVPGPGVYLPQRLARFPLVGAVCRFRQKLGKSPAEPLGGAVGPATHCGAYVRIALPIARPASQWQRGAIRSVPSITRGHTRAALSRRYRQAGSMKMHSRPAKESQSGRGHSSGRPCLRGQRSSGGAALSVSPRLSVRAWALSTAAKGSPNPLHV